VSLEITARRGLVMICRFYDAYCHEGSSVILRSSLTLHTLHVHWLFRLMYFMTY